MKIQLLHFDGCPNVDAARAAIRDAIAAEQVDVTVEEVDVQDPAAPDWARGWGSPTILVNGVDVVGEEPSTSTSCRLYPGGAPSVTAIRDRLRGARPAVESPRRGVTLPVIGAVTAAIAASACCLVPAVLAAVGVSGAGFAAGLAPYRPFFLAATGAALAAGFWFAYRPQKKDACGCPAPRSRRAARVTLWFTTLVTVALATYPLLGDGKASAGSQSAAARATLELKVTGMDCKECTGTIANRLRKVLGVVSATVDFESGIAVVRYDGREGMERAAIAAVEDAGFEAAVRR